MPTDDERLADLLLQWQDYCIAGQPATASELCRDCPELASELQRRINAVQRMDRLVADPYALTPPGDQETADYASSPSAEAPPVQIPGYELLAALGHGGMGVVYKARDLKFRQRLVAIKMILAGSHATPEQRTRFQAEAEALARVQHPHIVQVITVGEHEDKPFLVMEFIEGGSLAQRLDGQPQPFRDAAQLVEILARAVHTAHERGIIHRDLKPANVLLAPASDGGPWNTAYGLPKVSDFGLAKLCDGSAAPSARAAP